MLIRFALLFIVSIVLSAQPKAERAQVADRHGQTLAVTRGTT
jgi:hypothetical protein